MKKSYTLISLLLLITSQASAGQYAIHLDTSKSTNLSDYETLSVFGELYTVAATEGYTSTLLGSYETKRLAGVILNKVREDGHFGAYIIKNKNERSQIARNINIAKI